MSITLGQRSRDRLIGVHPDMVKVIERAAALSSQDFTILEGVRTPTRQKELYAQGRTKPGNIVTWTMTSNHFVNAKTGFGHAVDICPFPIDWTDTEKFNAVAAVMFQAAAELGIKIRWGADWDRDGKPRERGEADSPHWELAP